MGKYFKLIAVHFFVILLASAYFAHASEDGSHVMDVAGYYDFTFIDDTLNGNNGTFRQHHLSLFLGKEVKKFRFFSEVEWEFGAKIDKDGTCSVSTHAAGAADTGTCSISGTDRAEILVETAWLEYNSSNFFNIRVGKHLTPYGWWNINHYPILVLTTSRPESTRRIFPQGTTGIQLYGSAYAGKLQADYNLYYANDVNNDNTNEWDTDSNKALGGRAVLHMPGVIPAFDIFDLGFSALGGKSDRATENLYLGFDELIHIGNFELLGEFAYNRQKTLSNDSKAYQKGYYIQPSYAIPLSDFGTLTIIYRYDNTDTSSRTVASNDKVTNTLALNYKPIPDVAMKGEINWINPEKNGTTRRYTDVEFSINIFF